MSRTYQILIAGVLALVAVGGYWKMVIAPKRAAIVKLDQQIATHEAELAQTQSLIVTYQGARDAYETNYATFVRLGKAVPTDDDTRSLVVQLDAAAKRSAVDFSTINVNGGGAAGGSTASAAIIPGAVNAGSFSAMPFTFSFDGTFATLGNFFSRLERFVSVNGDKISVSGRLLRLESIQLQPGEGGWPSLTAQVGASSYIVPVAEAPTAAAATTAPATAAAAAAPSSSSTNEINAR